MAISIKKISLTAAAIISGLFFYFAPASAQELLKNTLGEISGKVENIGKIQENRGLTSQEKNIQETEARKQALSKIFEITLLENKDLKENLGAVNNLTDEEQKIKIALLKSLEENRPTFQLMENRLGEAETLNEIKQLASDLKNWRSSVYNPKAENISIFTLIFKQKGSIKTAGERLQKIEKDLKNYESAELKGDDINKLIKKSADGINNAEALNNKSEKMITEILNQKLFTPIGLFSKLSLKNLFSKNTPATAKKHAGDALQQLQSAYQTFIDIGELAKEKIK